MGDAPMERIWEAMVKADPSKGGLVVFTEFDLKSLYYTGFVDAEKYSLDEWVKAFSRDRKKVGKFDYEITKESWMTKGKFRFNGTVRAPLDASWIKEGEWTEEQLERLKAKFLVPSLVLTKDQLDKLIDPVVKFQGKINITKKFKLAVKSLLDRYASPVRQREVDFLKFRETNVRKEVEQKKAVAAEREKSTFAKGQDKLGEKSKKLDEITKGNR